MSLIAALVIRLLPIVAILLLRRGVVSGWVLALVIVVTIVMVVVNLYADYLRGAYYANESNPTVAAALQARLNRWAPLRLWTWIAYVIGLALLVVV